mmetsp:Transcript_12794/g.32748  ORF Transcript_12794/g.32748 Transcript_12794/m.32748 type:complete len:223 (-) Transcript_12794:257-925(-)
MRLWHPNMGFRRSVWWWAARPIQSLLSSPRVPPTLATPSPPSARHLRSSSSQTRLLRTTSEACTRTASETCGWWAARRTQAVQYCASRASVLTSSPRCPKPSTPQARRRTRTFIHSLRAPWANASHSPTSPRWVCSHRCPMTEANFCTAYCTASASLSATAMLRSRISVRPSCSACSPAVAVLRIRSGRRCGSRCSACQRRKPPVSMQRTAQRCLLPVVLDH